MLLYRTGSGWVVDRGNGTYVRPLVQDGLTEREDLFEYLR